MRYVLLTGLALLAPLVARGQMDHAAHVAAQNTTGAPTHAGQEAFATISEIAAILKSDPSTDWSKVDLEALRQHLIDMDDVTMRASAKATNVAGGVALDISGDGRARDAVQRIVLAHAPMLDAMPDYHATATQTPNGARLTVVARNPQASDVVARIRGLGFSGLLTEGAHHQAHHLAIARGEGEAAHHH